VKRFGWVFFVPGNHDLWCKGARAGADLVHGSSNSLAKLACIRSLCRRLGVHTAPTRVPPPPGCTRGCWVVPLLSWYHGSFDHEPDIDYLELPQAKHVVRDFSSCVWPHVRASPPSCVSLGCESNPARATSDPGGGDGTHTGDGSGGQRRGAGVAL
jgi:hypothetical protein